ncbi:MAG: exonuclease SbcCD subunit D C-terminal domain-containing protein [Verrucomicrobiales bacterium]|nr:exonuclease SbcCD subunit D C-terminal domain-containing protein [Verrucomicrobiales bacterium]
MKILHTADWHLGKLLNDQSRDTEHALFLEWLLTVVKDEGIDAVLVAGDIFDTANPPQSALQRYYDFVSRLFTQGNCELIIIAGNHDSAAQLEAPKQVLNSVKTHVTGFLPETPEDRLLLLPDAEAPEVAIALIPFLRDRDLRVGTAGESADEIRAQLAGGISARYEETAKALEAAKLSCPAIATGHLTVVGSKTSDSERDIHIGGLGSVTPGHFPEVFDYVALGHLHRPQSADGSGRVRYSGSPIALSFSESKDKKEVRILEISNGEITQTSVPIPVFRKLSQIRTSTAELEKSIEEFSAKAGNLRTWVELIVEDALLEDNLTERVATLIADRDFDVLKVIRGRANTPLNLSAGEATDDEAIESLLDQPTLVFEHLLDQQEQFTDEEADELKRAFAKLVEMEAQPDLIDAP